MTFRFKKEDTVRYIDGQVGIVKDFGCDAIGQRFYHVEFGDIYERTCVCLESKLDKYEMAPTERIYREIVAERKRQDEKWGGAEHDDAHVPSEWFELITDRCSNYNVRKNWTQIAALAIAALESLDRKEKHGNQSQ